MKVDKGLMKDIAQQALVGNAVTGGIAQSNFEITKTDEGLLLRLNTPSLDESAYRIQVAKGTLMLFTMFKSSFVDNTNEEGEEEQEIQPAIIHNYPLPPKVNQDKIEAIFDHGELRVYLPFYQDGDLKPRNIDIQRYK